MEILRECRNDYMRTKNLMFVCAMTDLDPKVFKAIEQTDDTLGSVGSLVPKLQFLPLSYKVLPYRLKPKEQFYHISSLNQTMSSDQI